jgi:hypothetical protein
MDTKALIFMLISEGTITFAVIYFFVKVLRSNKKEHHHYPEM